LGHITLKYLNHITKESNRFRKEQEGSVEIEKEKSLTKPEFPGKMVYYVTFYKIFPSYILLPQKQ